MAESRRFRYMSVLWCGAYLIQRCSISSKWRVKISCCNWMRLGYLFEECTLRLACRFFIQCCSLLCAKVVCIEFLSPMGGIDEAKLSQAARHKPGMPMFRTCLGYIFIGCVANHRWVNPRDRKLRGHFQKGRNGSVAIIFWLKNEKWCGWSQRNQLLFKQYQLTKSSRNIEKEDLYLAFLFSIFFFLPLVLWRGRILKFLIIRSLYLFHFVTML